MFFIIGLINNVEMIQHLELCAKTRCISVLLVNIYPFLSNFKMEHMEILMNIRRIYPLY